ncbi:hypothetical protein [Corynebacterium sp. NML120713]|uniref:hypothetical protein n=1 Tax=Corynebacterium sp. NML120713 TaxID=1906332 RepID=UPI0008FB4BED|nr:hypothetical protein [Corynebacterium sp. NML120713]OIR43204.1 hypothetical protein BJP06_06385 [Corynebacterium sp. NML120713]
MSLLDQWNKEVEVYLEEAVTDRDGNIRTRPSKEPVKLKVWLAPVGQSGTSARRAEQDNEGYETEQVMRMRLRRRDHGVHIGAQSKVVFDGQTWSVFGDRVIYRGSARTKHHDYTLRRS